MQQWQKQAVARLRGAIARDTSNPPGNELILCDYLRNEAEKAGLYQRILKTAPGRGNILISPVEKWLEPEKSGFNDPDQAPLILLSHLDVVPANPDEWSFDPFSGDLRDGIIQGRGTLDTKQLTIMHLSALEHLAETLGTSAERYKRPVILMATADEERGSSEGLLKLLETHREWFRGASVLSEGGGFPLRLNNRSFYLCESGQKGAAKVKITWKKQPGSNPFFPDLSASGEAAEVVRKINEIPWNFFVPEAVTEGLRRIATGCVAPGNTSPNKAGPDELLDIIQPYSNDNIQAILRAMASNTCAVTRMEGGRKNPEIKAPCDFALFLDCRLLPGCTRSDFESYLKTITEGTRGEPEIMEFREGFVADPGSELFDTLERELREQLPEVRVVPFVSIGGSDGRFLAPHGARVYGWSPVLPDLTFDRVVSLVHGIDERIPVDSFLFGCENIRRVVRKMIVKENNR